ncbi:hypothetical protein Daus18300_010109 [Diaporthe australafricana]|uniref:Transmembrane protein n=1 Tax=Diaporthe australafricana TaxID=127596 RepID=A0ABR3WBK6_9PEZI
MGVIRVPEEMYVPVVCIVWGATAVFIALVVATLVIKDLTVWRGKILPKLPASFNDNATLRRTITALIIIVPAITWPVWIALGLPLIIIGWAVAHILECVDTRRERGNAPDLELGTVNTPNGASREAANESGDQLLAQTVPRSLSLRQPTHPTTMALVVENTRFCVFRTTEISCGLNSQHAVTNLAWVAKVYDDGSLERLSETVWEFWLEFCGVGWVCLR